MLSWGPLCSLLRRPSRSSWLYSSWRSSPNSAEIDTRHPSPRLTLWFFLRLPLPFEFYSHQQDIPHNEVRGQTLPAHRTLPFRCILLDPFEDAVLFRQCRCFLWWGGFTMWKLCPHFPETGGISRCWESFEGEHIRKLQSSPGYLHVGHVPSKCTWQIPQTSSSGMSHLQVATAFHLRILTFMLRICSQTYSFGVFLLSSPRSGLVKAVGCRLWIGEC